MPLPPDPATRVEPDPAARIEPGSGPRAEPGPAARTGRVQRADVRTGTAAPLRTGAFPPAPAPAPYRPDGPTGTAAPQRPGAGADPGRPDSPPRPAAPPRPGVPPRPAQAPTAYGTGTAGSAEAGPDASDWWAPAADRHPRGDAEAARPGDGTRDGGPTTDGEPSDRGPGKAAGAPPNTEGGARPPYPRFRLGRPTATATDAPPPRASARFPDGPPTVGREATDAREAPADRATAPAAPPPAPRTAGDTTAPAPATASAPGTPGRTRDAAASQGPGPSDRTPHPAGPPRTPPHRPGAPAQAATETTRRLRPVPAGPEDEGRSREEAPRTDTHGRRAGTGPDPALSWGSAPTAYGEGRPRVSFGEPEGYDGSGRPRPLGGRLRPQALAAAVCLVLGAGLLTGAVTGSWLAGDSGDDGARGAFAEAGELWHSVPVDQLFPPTVQGRGAGPGGADRTWTRVAVAPDGGCKGAFDGLLAKVLDPVGCSRLLRATYTDATRSHVTTVGLLFTKADAAAMTALANRFEKEGLGRRTDLMPLPYAAEDTVAAGFGARQRASWTVSVLTDAPVVVYAVSGWADDRTVDEPEPAEEATESGAASAPAQAGLGHEAQGLADRVERALRKNVGQATEQPS
ncbi:hypothetical protein [Streptomyces olivaceus]|uniref:hypothetical protein n=1 Tax=Streptomyces olivaceus TaxID=47716 RepID=UPI0036F0022F